LTYFATNFVQCLWYFVLSILFVFLVC
jgi:hypothetical protein